MDHSPSITTEISNIIVKALRSTGYFESTENIPVAEPYRKHIIWLKKRSNEANLNVVINAEFQKPVSCNRTAITSSRLLETPLGYLRLEYPAIVGTLLPCAPTDVEIVPLDVTDNRLAYSSASPIVIHAHRDIDISYVVEEEATATEG